MTSPRLSKVDWSRIPAPMDDGATRHLEGRVLPDVALASTSGGPVVLSTLRGRVVVYAYPLTGRPDVALPAGWDEIPGARGCTPQSCAFRDHADDLRHAGAVAIYGLSTQDTAYQTEAAERLHLTFPLLSDAGLTLARALSLPTMDVAGRTLLKRLTWIAEDGVIAKVFYPVFPPDRNAADVLAWLTEHPS